MRNDSHRTITGEALAPLDTSAIRTIIGATYLALCTSIILLSLPIDTVGWLRKEDGPIENAGALSFLLAGATFLVAAYRSSELHRQYGTNHIESPLALLALGALCLVCAGEEISWGQRLFGYSVPAWLEDINRQGEWNLHNLAWFHAKTEEGTEKSFWARLFSMQRLLALFQLMLCTLVPMLTVYSEDFRAWIARVGVPIVPWWIAGLVPFHFLVSQALYAIIGDQPILGGALDETKETLRAFIFLVVAIWTYTQTTYRESHRRTNGHMIVPRAISKIEGLAGTQSTAQQDSRD